MEQTKESFSEYVERKKNDPTVCGRCGHESGTYIDEDGDEIDSDACLSKECKCWCVNHGLLYLSEFKAGKEPFNPWLKTEPPAGYF